MRDDQGREIFRQLVKKFDIVVENFRPGVMKKMGLDYENLRGINPKIIYAAISGFGQDGPYANKSAFDFIIAGYSGLMSVSAHPGGEPIRIGIGLIDITSGMFAAIGILGALRHRLVTGEGQMVEAAMMDCATSLMENPIARYFATGKNPDPPGNQHPYIVPMGVFPSKDGFFIIAVGNDNLWQRFCKAIGREDLLSDPNLVTNTGRQQNQPRLHGLLSDALRKKTSAEWIKILDGAGVPCGPLNNVEQTVKEPPLLSRNMIMEINHPQAGPIKLTGTPIKLSKARDDLFSSPPALGQHTEEVLQSNLGMTKEQIGALRKKGVVV